MSAVRSDKARDAAPFRIAAVEKDVAEPRGGASRAPLVWRAPRDRVFIAATITTLVVGAFLAVHGALAGGRPVEIVYGVVLLLVTVGLTALIRA